MKRTDEVASEAEIASRAGSPESGRLEAPGHEPGDLPPVHESSRLAAEQRDRPRALLRASGLFAASATLIALAKRGFFDGVASQLSEFAGLTLGLCGFLYLLCVYRFRVSIGRFMTIVALAALLLRGFLAYWNWLEGR